MACNHPGCSCNGKPDLGRCPCGRWGALHRRLRPPRQDGQVLRVPANPSRMHLRTGRQMMHRGVSRNLGAVPWCSTHPGAMPARMVSPAQTPVAGNRVASVWELSATKGAVA